MKGSNAKKLFLKEKTALLTAKLKLAKAEADRWQRKFRQLADTVPHIVWMAREDGTITFINKRWEELIGHPLGNLSEKADKEIIHPDDRDKFIEKMNSALKTRSAYMVEYRMKNKKNEYRWYADRAAPTVKHKSFPTKWIGTTTDINDRKVAEEQKNEFLGMVTHELKTPLTSVKAFAQILEGRFERSGDEKSAALLSKMGTQLHKLQVVIADLLDITKLDTGRLRFHQESFSLLDLTREVVDEMGRMAIEHTIRISHNKNIDVFADRDKIAQVLTNLLTNAIKYSPNKRDIVVAIRAKGKFVTLSVQDFGVGIAKDAQKNIFERFYRAPGKMAETFPGLGLGLYIVKEIMDLHGGRVRVKSEKRVGSTFYIDIPYDNKK